MKLLSRFATYGAMALAFAATASCIYPVFHGHTNECWSLGMAHESCRTSLVFHMSLEIGLIAIGIFLLAMLIRNRASGSLGFPFSALMYSINVLIAHFFLREMHFL